MGTRTRALTISTVSAIVFLLGLLDLLDMWLFQGAVEGGRVNDVITAVIICIIVGLGTWWVLYYKHKGVSLFTIGLFPAVTIFPYVLFADSITSTFLSGLESIPSVIISTLGFWLLCYLLILTANVLNGSVLYAIPLGQAGKASQFVFTLLTTYLLAAYLFGNSFSVALRLIIIGAFIFYTTYSCIWTLQIPGKQVMTSSGAITLTMMLAITALSIWPIVSIYATVVLTVIFYVLLNVALEMREKISRSIWIEYSSLLLIVLVMLIVIAEWGINGTLV